MSVMKIIAAAMAAFGLIFFLYGFSDRTAGGILQIGGLFLSVSAVIFAMSILDAKLAKLASILNDLDSTLTVPSLSLSGIKTEPPPIKQRSFTPVVAAGAAIAGVGAVVASVASTKTEEKPVDIAQKRDYFNELAQYLEPLPEKNEDIAPAKQEASVTLKLEQELEDFTKTNFAPLETKVAEKTNDIASDFPELDAILNKKEPVVLEPAPVAVEPEKMQANELSLIREGVINAIPFRLYSDGSIDADFSNGSHRFATLGEFRAYVDPK